ncbi:energy transducer TonB [Mucilaginibacter lappiensis]|uniref:TonB family protein n=1 Tax=Mucilaginibacter lappiensis TaxID=354630 RepID=A0A841JA05_9SPHI|nr:energy transducer TonB [Mucilaginibacter lappiensis]MBB6127514.1 TonB family protein [Mucilaginibacter lappiensis]
MKKLLLIGIVLTLFFKAEAQIASTPTTDTTEVFTRIDQVPEFPGGLYKFSKYLDKNLKYPKEAKENNIQGRVTVTFVVEKDGSLSDSKVTKSLTPETDAEAIRLIKNSPKWIPGKQGGRPVRVLYSIPITFQSN